MTLVNWKKKWPATSLPLGLIFLTLICLYALVLIYPDYRLVSQVRRSIQVEQAKLERLKVLYPVFARSQALDKVPFEHRLPLPLGVKIYRNELATLSLKISETATRNHMTLSGSNFDINSLKNKSQSVSMTIKLKGEFFEFRQFLIDLIAFEFFDSIERFDIRADEGTMKNFIVNLNIMIKSNE
jgi:hypothetical protein